MWREKWWCGCAQLRMLTPRVKLKVAAAIDIVDREGVDALTIRRVAETCGLSPMGLYRHVRDKRRPARPGR
jgi:AcrR family transcriptional regulator